MRAVVLDLREVGAGPRSRLIPPRGLRFQRRRSDNGEEREQDSSQGSEH